MSQSLHAPSLPGLLPHCHTGFSSLTLSLHLASILVSISHLSLLFSLPKLTPCQTNLSSPSFKHSTIYVYQSFLTSFPTALCVPLTAVPSLQTQHFPGTISLPRSAAGKEPAWSCSSCKTPWPLSAAITSPTEQIQSLENPSVTGLKSC